MKLFKHRAAWWLLVLGSLIPLTFAGGVVAANPSTVGLGASGSFAILSGAGITNVPTSSITGDVGASPITGAAIGLTCPQVSGTIYAVDAFGPAPCAVANPGLLTTAKNDLTAAYGDAAGRTPDSTFGAADNQLGGQTLVPGVYRFGSAATANLIGNLTLAGDASSVWIFQASSTLVAQSGSTITLTGGAQACNIFWQVGTSATIRTGAAFVGTIMADQSISLLSAATLQGRALARIASVTLDNNTITKPTCAVSGSGGSGGSGSGGSNATPASSPADVGVVKSASPASVAVGGSVTYTSIVTNHGPGVATNVAFNDVLPAGQSLVSVTTTQGNCAGTTTVVCAVGTLALDQSESVVIVVRATTAGSFVNTARISADQADQNVAANNTSEARVIVGTPIPPPTATTPVVTPPTRTGPTPTRPTPRAVDTARAKALATKAAAAKKASAKKAAARRAVGGTSVQGPALPAKNPRGFTG